MYAALTSMRRKANSCRVVCKYTVDLGHIFTNLWRPGAFDLGNTVDNVTTTAQPLKILVSIWLFCVGSIAHVLCLPSSLRKCREFAVIKGNQLSVTHTAREGGGLTQHRLRQRVTRSSYPLATSTSGGHRALTSLRGGGGAPNLHTIHW